jgi:serine protease
MKHHSHNPLAWTAGLFFALVLAAPSAHAEQWLVRSAAAAPTGYGPELSAVPFEDHGVRLVQRYRSVPWAAVEGTREALEAMQRAGLISGFEPDLPRHLLDAPAARPAAFPWLVALSLLALAACGGDDGTGDTGPKGGPAQTTSWGYLKIHAQEAHARNRGHGVKVAVIDTGIDVDHPDLKVVSGVNLLAGSPAPGAVAWDDCNGHGTHVAGIIAALDNSIGVVGVAPEAQLYAARIFDCQAQGATVARIVAAVDWAIEQKVQVINMSFGSSFSSQAEQDVMAAAEQAGIVLVAASGNESIPGQPAAPDYPGAYPSVVAVGATDENDKLADFSNQGPDLELSAPGVNILSTVPVGTALQAKVQSGSNAYDAIGMTYSGIGTVKAKLYSCGMALTSADCPSGVRGNIALILRGQNFFSEKVQNAMAAGASAAVIYNHTEDGGGLFGGTLQNAGRWIPAVSVSNSSGLALKGLGDGASATVAVESADYDLLSGTSMASPHVAGVAALVIGAQPGLKPAEVRARIEHEAVDLGATGRDVLYGFGRVDAQRAVAAPAADSPPEPVPARSWPGPRWAFPVQ